MAKNNNSKINLEIINNLEKRSIFLDTAFIATVYNEQNTVSLLLKSLIEQEVLPSQIIIVDGGSFDRTIQRILDFFEQAGVEKDMKSENAELKYIISKFFKIKITNIKIILSGILYEKIKVLVVKVNGASISKGRNIAIKLSSCKDICVSDGGCILDKSWLKNLKDLLKDKNLVIGGYSAGLADTFLKLCLAVCVIPLKNEIKYNKFMPSSRNILFKKEAWENAGMYPEYMDYGEDMKFNFNLIKNGYKIIYNPDAVVYWNLRNSVYLIFKQFFRYAKGDAIGKMYFYRHLIRIFSFGILGLLIFLTTFYNVYFFILILFLFTFYCIKPYLRIRHYLNDRILCPYIYKKDDSINNIFINNDFISKKNSYNFIKNAIKNGYIIKKIFTTLKLAFAIPFMLVLIDTAKLFGYIYGLIKLLIKYNS